MNHVIVDGCLALTGNYLVKAWADSASSNPSAAHRRQRRTFFSRGLIMLVELSGAGGDVDRLARSILLVKRVRWRRIRGAADGRAAATCAA